MDRSGPYPLFTLIYAHRDGLGQHRRAAFVDVGEACEHARKRLLGMPTDWYTAIVARGVDAEGADLTFIGCWERLEGGGVAWESASLA